MIRILTLASALGLAAGLAQAETVQAPAGGVVFSPEAPLLEAVQPAQIEPLQVEATTLEPIAPATGAVEAVGVVPIGEAVPMPQAAPATAAAEVLPMPAPAPATELTPMPIDPATARTEIPAVPAAKPASAEYTFSLD